MGLELNLLRFIFIMFQLSREGATSGLKYFLIQRFGSRVFLLGLVDLTLRGRFGALVITVALLFKLAIAPFQFWLVNISGSVG